MYDAVVQQMAHCVVRQDISAHVHHSDVSGQSGCNARISRSTLVVESLTTLVRHFRFGISWKGSAHQRMILMFGIPSGVAMDGFWWLFILYIRRTPSLQSIRPRPQQKNPRCMAEFWSNILSLWISTETIKVSTRHNRRPNTTWTVSSVASLLIQIRIFWMSSRILSHDVPKLGRLAVIVKLEKDMSKKVRLVVDMVRNGTHGRIWLCDRVVLPRMWDTVESLLDLLEYRQHSLQTRWNVWLSCDSNDARYFLEFRVVDFMDAFCTLHTLRRGMSFCCGSWSHSMGGVSLCCFWLDVWTFRRSASLHLHWHLPVTGGPLGAPDASFAWTIRYSSRQVLASKDCDSHCCASALGSSGLRPELEEGPERPQSRVGWWRIQFALGRSCSATHRSRNPGRKGNIDELLHGHAMLPIKKLVSFIGCMSWIASVAPVSRLICLDALQSNHRTYPVDAEEKRDKKVVRWLRSLLSLPSPLRRTFGLSVEEVLHGFRFALMHHRLASGVIIRHHCRPEANCADSLSNDKNCRVSDQWEATLGAMGTACNSDFFACVPQQARPTVVQSDSLAALSFSC